MNIQTIKTTVLGACVGLLAFSAAAATRIENLSFPNKTAVTAGGTYTASSQGTDFVLSGTIDDNVVILADEDCCVTLSDVTLNAQLIVTGNVYLVASGTSTLTKSKSTVVDCTGTLVLAGDGTATYAGGGAKLGVISADTVDVQAGTHLVNMTFTTKKNGYGIYVGSAYEHESGIVKITSSCTEYKDLGITGPKKSTATISGGLLEIDMPGPKSCGINMDKSSCTTTISGGCVVINMSGDAAKGIKSDGTFNMTGGILNATISGNVVFEPYEGEDENENTLYYYCTVSSSTIVAAGTYLMQDSSKPYAVKCATVNVSGGTMRLAASGTAGRGLGADDDLTVSGGFIDIAVYGGASDYLITFEDSNCITSCLDRTTACCIKQGSAEGTATFTGGTIYLTATNTAGKCMSIDGSLVIGTEGASTLPTDSSFSPDIQCTTYGTKLFVSAQKLKNYYKLGTVTSTTNDITSTYATVTSSNVTSGSGDNVDYTNPKCCKAVTDIHMYSGRLRFYSANDGGEGFESKAAMTIDGGIIEGTCYDDVINTGSALNINGGYLYCGSTGNDAIDSNGTITITDGIVLAFTLANPEVGIDTDSASYFKVTGGILLSCGSATDMAVAPKSSETTQSYYLSTSASASTYAGKYLKIAGTSTYVKVPSMSSTSGSLSLLVSAPGCSSSAPTATSSPSGTSVGFHGVYE